ncbi:MAG TPA: helix-turn-helix transcriptional regulator [Trebonia sp.]
MSIGGTLAEARQAAGLTVADVSARTRIRAGLIRAIEHDDFSSCGGDFYARGHIRAIARVVGVDSQPLIAEYDAASPDARSAGLEDLLLPPSAADEPPPGGPRPPRRQPRPARVRRRRLLWLPGPLALLAAVALAVIGGGAYELTAGIGPQHAGAAGTVATPRSAATAAPVVAAPATQPATAQPAVTPSPSPSPSAAARQVTPSSVAAVGPGGTGDGDNSGNASQALSGDPSSPWRTEWYTSASFGNLKPGTGLLFTLPSTVTATQVTIRLGIAGPDLQVRAGTSPGSLPTVASASSAGSTVRLPLASRPRVRYLELWFTRLAPDGNGTYQAAVYSVTVSALQSS